MLLLVVVAAIVFVFAIAGLCICQNLGEPDEWTCLALASKFAIIPKGVRREWLSANGA